MTAEFPLAVHAMVYLLHKNTLVSSFELAENICTNPARVRKVMAKLHRAKLVEAQRGKGSGYIIATDGGALTLRAVLSALNEEAIDMEWRSGDMDKDCLIASGMGGIMDGIYAGLNEVCLDRLAMITIGDINEKIFGGGQE